jgi:hypothetical protein
MTFILQGPGLPVRWGRPFLCAQPRLVLICGFCLLSSVRAVFCLLNSVFCLTIGFVFARDATRSVAVILSHKGTYGPNPANWLCFFKLPPFKFGCFGFRIPVFTGTSLPLRRQGCLGFPAEGRRLALFFPAQSGISCHNHFSVNGLH